MSVTLAFTAGFLLYTISVIGMYTPSIKTHPWYIPGSMVLAMIASFLWSWVVKNTPEDQVLYLRGVLWDAMLIGTYSLLPFAFGVRLSGMAAFGVLVTLVGIVIIKLN